MAKVEGMPLDGAREGVDWNWETFGEYLDAARAARIAVNAGFLVGHCALRRYVMGADAVGNEATDDADRRRWSRLLHESIEAGGLGFSTTLSTTHSDGDGKPVASPLGEQEELLALCAGGRRARGHHPRGHRRRLPRPVRRRRDRAARADVARPPSARSTGTSSPSTPRVPERVPRQLRGLRRARASSAAGSSR